ncbi:MAG: hypothetical protein ACAI25_16075 [Planctomycetota bacterium]
MRPYVPFVVAALIFAAAPARADDKKEGGQRSHRLPFNPLAKAKAKDFSVLEGAVTLQMEGEKKVSLRWEVVSVLDDAVAVSLERFVPSYGASKTKATVEFDLEKAPTLASYFGFEGRKISDVEVSDDKREVKDKTFACKKVTFTAGYPDDGRRWHKVTAWFCADVAASGLVAFKSEDEFGSKLEVTITSFGNGQTDTWSAVPPGEKADGIFWRDAGIGSIYETKVVTDMKKPMEMKSETVLKSKLKAKNDRGYTLETEMAVGEMKLPATDQEVEWPENQRTPDTGAKVEELGDEDLKVGGETYRCKHFRTESDASGMKTTTESWTHRGLVIKSVSKNENYTVTMEATRITKN